MPRTPTYLSPTSISTYYKNADEFYLRYLADHRPPRFPQTDAMAIGSSFDAFVKSYLHEKLFGKNKDERFNLRTLFEAQVEKQWWSWAWRHGQIVFDAYNESGTLADLIVELEGAIGQPKFESEMFGTVDGEREGVTIDAGGVPLLGKPDVYFINKHGAHVILDWKVNGYCSQWGASPMQGYVRLREIGQPYTTHKTAQCAMVDGIIVNISGYLDHYNKDWARQLSIYSWLCGEEVGAKFIAAIDQIACRNGKFKFAEHRLRVSSDFQWNVFAQAQTVWKAVTSGHFFLNMTREESAARCKLLDDQHKAFEVHTTEDQQFLDLCK